MGYHQLKDGTLSERGLQNAIIDLAQLLNYRCMHARPARTRNGGWVTPIQGDRGYFDLTLLNSVRAGFVFAELKSQQGKVEPDQILWLDQAAAVEDHVYLWRPVDWVDGTVERVLKYGVVDEGSLWVNQRADVKVLRRKVKQAA